MKKNNKQASQSKIKRYKKNLKRKKNNPGLSASERIRQLMRKSQMDMAKAQGINLPADFDINNLPEGPMEIMNPKDEETKEAVKNLMAGLGSQE
jgi:hypothetical protein